MVSGLPDRPLSYPDLEALTISDAIDFVLPVLPHSVRRNEENEIRVHDLLITTGETIVSVVYEEDEGWTVVGTSPHDAPNEAVINHVVDYRGYEIKDKEKALEYVTELYDLMDEASSDG